MEYALGFVIATFIGLTGVGAGTMTTPLLILILGMPTSQAVGTALIFGASIKLITTPFYWKRGQIDKVALAYLLGTGLPGVLIGSLLLSGIKSDWVTVFVGLTIMIVSLFNLFRFTAGESVDRKPWLAFVGLPIGLEVGFSSAGAGALGSLALMNLTKLAPAAVVGTDLTFGLVLNMIGGGIRAAMGDLNSATLVKLLAGGAIGAILGSLLAQKLPSQKLKFVLCLALVALGGNLAWKGLSTAMAW
jgi:uncharacterized membrane protein YfcA